MTDPKKSKEALLGELESIKDLLSDEDLAAIPTLEDALPPETTGTAPDPLESEPSLDDNSNAHDHDDIPTLSEPAWSNPEFSDALNSTTGETLSAEYDATEFEPSDIEFSELHPAELDIPELHIFESNAEEKETTISEPEVDVDTNTQTTPEEISTSESEEIPTLETPILSDASGGSNNHLEASQSPSLFSRPRDMDLSLLSRGDSIPENANDQPGISPQSESQAEADTHTDSETLLPEPILAPNALPGQQSLFSAPQDTPSINPQSSSETSSENVEPEAADSDEGLNKAVTDSFIDEDNAEYSKETDEKSFEQGSEDEADITDEERTEENDDENDNSETLSASSTDKHLNASPTAKGENPFLPKHIRERLHTHRSLMDVIKYDPIMQSPQRDHQPTEPRVEDEQPIAASTTPAIGIPEEKLNQIIQEVLKAQLPKIEQDIKQRVLQELDSTRQDNNPSHNSDATD